MAEQITCSKFAANSKPYTIWNRFETNWLWSLIIPISSTSFPHSTAKSLLRSACYSSNAGASNLFKVCREQHAVHDMKPFWNKLSVKLQLGQCAVAYRDSSSAVSTTNWTFCLPNTSHSLPKQGYWCQQHKEMETQKIRSGAGNVTRNPRLLVLLCAYGI